jgi:LEA14-like dessication related protein
MTLPRFRLAATLVLALSIGLTGCAIFGPTWNTDVALMNVRIADVTVFQASMIFTLRIDNEEPEPLILDGSTHEITIDGVRVGKGMFPDRVEIPRLSSVTIDVPVDVSTIALILPIRSAIESRQFDYQVSSTLYVLRGGSTRKVGVTKQGRADFAELQR